MHDVVKTYIVNSSTSTYVHTFPKCVIYNTIYSNVRVLQYNYVYIVLIHGVHICTIHTVNVTYSEKLLAGQLPPCFAGWGGAYSIIVQLELYKKGCWKRLSRNEMSKKL